MERKRISADTKAFHRTHEKASPLFHGGILLREGAGFF